MKKKAKMRWLYKTKKITLYFFQALLAYLLYGILWLIPLDCASAVMGWAGEKIGPFTFMDEVAKANLELVFPEKTAAEKRAIRLGMWNNIGRMLAEYVHIGDYLGDKKHYITIKGQEVFDKLKLQEKGGFIVSGHLANWEMANITSINQGIPMNIIYRAPNNFFVEPIYRLRQKKSHGELIPKGRYGAKRILHLLRKGKYIGLLADQKMTRGLSLPFLGHPATTLDSIAVFALSRKCLIVPGRIKRTKGARFEAILYPPMEITDTGDRNKDVKDIMLRVNNLLSEWILDTPEQWLWIHDRWGLKKKGLLQKKSFV